MRQKTHWVEFEPSYKPQMGRTIAQIFQSGTGFTIKRIYSLPQIARGVVAEIVSEHGYQELNLEMDSLTSPLKSLSRKPCGLGKGQGTG